MAVAYRSEAHAGPATGTTLTISKPSGTLDGDLLLLFVVNFNGLTVATPAGWSLLRSKINSGSVSVQCFSRVSSSDGASFNFTGLTADYYMASLIAMSGASSTADGTNDSQDFAETSKVLATPSVTTGTANDVIVRFAMGNDPGFGSPTLTAAWASSTERNDFNDGAGVCVTTATKALVAAGASGTENVTFTAPVNLAMIAMTIGVKDAPLATNLPRMLIARQALNRAATR